MQTRLSLTPQHNRFHGVGRKSQSEKGERYEDTGHGLVRLYIDGKFVALVPKEKR